MNNVLYSRCIVPAPETKEGDCPVQIVCTQENNGYGVWLTGFKGDRLVRWVAQGQRERAIEVAVDIARCIMCEDGGSITTLRTKSQPQSEEELPL